MRPSLFSPLLLLLTLLSYSADEVQAQQKAPLREKPEEATRSEPTSKGKITKTLSQLEAEALEAEKNAASSWFSQQYLQDASMAYILASREARSSGQLQRAVAHSNKALEIAKKARDPDLQAAAIFQLALTYRFLGQSAKARGLLQQALEVVKQAPLGPPREFNEANIYRELGMDFLRQGEAEKAVDYISYSLQAQESRLTFLRSAPRRPPPEMLRNAETALVVTVSQLGTAYERAGRSEEAIKTYHKGVEFAQTIGRKLGEEANLYLGLGRLYRIKGDFAPAMENLTKALAIAEEYQYGSLIPNASSQIGDLFLQTTRPTEAVPYYKKAIDTIESTRSLLESEELRTSFFEDKGQIYGGIILAYLGAKNLEEAFNYNERARSRAFLDILGSKVRLTRAGTLMEEERGLQAKIASLKARSAGEGADGDSTREERERLRRELAEAQKAYTDFLAKVRKENKEQASLMTVEPLTLKQLQEMLEPGVTVLEYFVLRGRAVLWVVEKEQVHVVRLSLNRSELIAKVGALRESIYQVGEKEKFNTLSQELYRVLIEPALPYVKGKELLVIPHDVLHYLPFQALLSEKGRYLIQDYPIYYLSSASLMQFTREKRRASRERALVMGNPSLGDSAYDLRFAEREAREVARLYPQSAVYLKTEATKSKAISSSPNYDILHFAVHGELREDEPLASGLLLASEAKQDGKLTVSDIFSLNLKADAVVLSACETGLGKITSGDEIIGLSRAFIYAGTPSVVTTLWKVNDRASYELMREFYTNLKSTKKSEALRQAQLRIMQDYPHPFFWAAYGLTGEP